MFGTTSGAPAGALAFGVALATAAGTGGKRVGGAPEVIWTKTPADMASVPAAQENLSTILFIEPMVAPSIRFAQYNLPLRKLDNHSVIG
jgi:hypothetical protein